MSARATSEKVAAWRGGATPAGRTGATLDGVNPGWKRIPESCCDALWAWRGGGEAASARDALGCARGRADCTCAGGAAVEECCEGVPGREEWRA